MRIMSGTVTPVRCGRRQGFSRGARGRQPARSEVDNPVIRGPDIKGHRVAFPAGLLCSVGDLGRSVVQPADRRQQARVVDCGQVMSCGHITRAGERAKLLEAA